MRKRILLSLLCIQAGYMYGVSPDYFEYLEKLSQPKGDCLEGEIEIVTDPDEIAEVQKVQKNRLLKKGFSESDAEQWSQIGVVREDQYWIWLRDAVYFPKKVPGTYNRLIWKSELKQVSSGVAVLPVLPSGQIVLNLNYRHATRSWELELPRGGMQPEETPEAAAAREVREETGGVVSSLTFLGNIAPDTGVLSSVVPVFLGKVAARQEATPEYSEAIADVLSFTKEQLQEGLVQGYIEVSIQGKKMDVPLRDSFLTFALLQAELRKLL